MKIFLGLVFGIIILTFTLNWVADPSQLRIELPSQLEENFIKKNPDQCDIDSAAVLMTRNPNYKLWLLEKRKAEVIVVGTSRVLAIRQDSFKETPFVNFGIANTKADDYQAIVGFLKKHPYIKTLLISVDIWDFVRYGFHRFWDQLIGPPESIRYKWLTPILINYFSWTHNGPYTGRLQRYWSLFKEYISYEATRTTIKRWWNTGSLRQPLYQLPLPTKSANLKHCVLSITPEFNRDGASSLADASQYTPEELGGKPINTIMDEFDDHRLDDSTSHWQLYKPLFFSKEFSTYRFAYMENLLQQASQLGVLVIGFEVPLPSSVVAIFKRLGLESMWNEFDERMKALFSKYNYKFVPLRTGRDIQCPEPSGYIDAWHPWYSCMKAVLSVLKNRDPRLPISLPP